MRTLFTIMNVSENSPSFQNWMQEVGIKHAKRVILTATSASLYFVVDTEDYNSILAVDHWVDPDKLRWVNPNDRHWEITACNKQYVREFVGDATRYLGSMCEVSAINARDHNKEQPYHWSLYDGEQDIHWHAEFRNPNTIRNFTSEPMKVLGTVTGRWPLDPCCPKPLVPRVKLPLIEFHEL